MSAFVVENATIGIILRGLLEMAPEVWEVIPGKTVKEKGDALFQMNADAVNQRYNEEDPAPKYNPMILSVSYMEEKGTLEYSPGQWYTSLRCFLYQCSEGNVPERELYLVLDELSEKMQHLQKNPAYEKSFWG